MKYKVLFSVALAVLITACTNQTQSGLNDIETQVYVRELKKSSINKLINTNGTALSVSTAELNSEMTGIYFLQTNPSTGKSFKLGDAVKKGQVIIKFENKEYENQQAVDSRKLSLELAELERASQQNLLSLGGVTEREMRNTEVTITNARYNLENAEINIGKMDVIAPFDGVIVSLPHYTQGVRVNQNSPMVGIMHYSQMYMEINLPESNMAYINNNQRVNITHYTLPGDTISGVISEMSPAISTETRTFRCKVLIDNKDLKLRSGMSVKADIIVDRAENTIIIPKDILISNRNRKYVYIVERNTAILRTVTTGLEDAENIQIIDGLNENDNLVIRGHETLRENSRVKVLR